jgi:hypothetical protein
VSQELSPSHRAHWNVATIRFREKPVLGKVRAKKGISVNRKAWDDEESECRDPHILQRCNK